MQHDHPCAGEKKGCVRSDATFEEARSVHADLETSCEGVLREHGRGNGLDSGHLGLLAHRRVVIIAFRTYDSHGCLTVEESLWNEEEAHQQGGTRQNGRDVHCPSPSHVVGDVATDEAANQGARGEEDGIDGLGVVSSTSSSFNCLIDLP